MLSIVIITLTLSYIALLNSLNALSLTHNHYIMLDIKHLFYVNYIHNRKNLWKSRIRIEIIHLVTKIIVLITKITH